MEAITKYKSKDGQAIELSFKIVKQYLVSGKENLVTQQEVAYFMGICKSRGLNPFKRDCYLVKYDNSPAAVITSIDYFRSRAREKADCKGWKKGIIKRTKDGTIEDSNGLLLDGEELLGGFFEARPANWEDHLRVEVNLRAYIKKTRDGRTTKFWETDNQPSQIMKVAESQGLRTVWPDEFQGLYTDSEIVPDTVFDTPSDVPQEPDTQQKKALPETKDFKDTIPQGTNELLLTQYLLECAKEYNCTVDVVQRNATQPEKIKGFWELYTKWVDKHPSVAPADEIESERRQLEARLSEDLVDREQFKVWLNSVKKLEFGADGRLSFNDLTSNVRKEVLADWKSKHSRYKKWLKKQTPEPGTQGLDVDRKEILFLAGNLSLTLDDLKKIAINHPKIACKWDDLNLIQLNLLRGWVDSKEIEVMLARLEEGILPE